MKYAKHWLAMAAILLCSITYAENQMLEDWSHTTTSASNTYQYYDFFTLEGAILSLNWSINGSSDDQLVFILDGNTVLTESGTKNGTYTTSLNRGKHLLTIRHYKAKSNTSSAQATISNVTIDGIADTVCIDGLSYWCTSDNTVSVVDCVTDETDIVIPETVQIDNTEYHVTIIEPKAFQSKSNLTSITIPTSVIKIGENAFGTYTKPRKVHISSIEAWCNIDFGNGNSNPLSDELYLNGELVEELVIPNTVKEIKDFVFLHCYSLTSLVIPEGITTIGKASFSTCWNIKSITIPEGITTIGENAFYFCNNLPSVVFPNSLRTIESKAFENCMNLSSITLPENLESIGDNAFCCCYDLFSVINNSQIPLQKGSKDYGYAAFYAKRILKDSELARYEDFTFYTIDGEHRLAGYVGNDSKVTLPVSYNGAPYLIDECAFAGSNLTSITIPEGITEIGSRAFYNCKSLTTTNLPKGVTEIKEHTFFGCSSLVQITLPEGIVSIGEQAFSECTNLETLELPQGVKSLGNLLFAHSYKFSTIVIPKSVESIGNGAFCERSVPINIHIEDIGWWCNVNIGNYYIGSAYNLYMNNELIRDLIIPEGVEKIQDSRFDSCDSITSVFIPKSVTDIGNYAFSGCKNLTSIRLPKNLNTLGDYAIASCPNLLNVYSYAESAPIVEESVFYNSEIEKATLHVLANSIESYRNTVPWSSFGAIIPINGLVTNITLNQSTATIFECETLTLTATVSPIQADDKSLNWHSSNESVAIVDAEGKVTGIAPGTATISAIANDGSGVSASCEVTVNELILGKCEVPIVTYKNGQVHLTCNTEDVKFITEVIAENAQARFQEEDFELTAAYMVTTYATKAKYENSDTLTVILCWIECTKTHKQDDDEGIINIPSQPVLILCNKGAITLTGLADGTEVMVYDLAGQKLGTATISNGTATINTDLSAGSTAIVKIGEHSIKVMMR